MIGRRVFLVKRSDGVQPFAEDERCADFEPVNAGADRDLGRRQRVGHCLEVERELNLWRAVEAAPAFRSPRLLWRTECAGRELLELEDLSTERRGAFRRQEQRDFPTSDGFRIRPSGQPFRPGQ